MADSLIPTDQPPESFTDEQKEWLNRMFHRASQSDRNSDILTPLTVVPADPITNKLYWFAQPIPASDIAYEGVYIYKSDGRWWALADLPCGSAWEDNTADLTAAKLSGGGSPTYIQVNGGNFDAPKMNGTPLIKLQQTFHIKHDAAQGSVIFPHVHWTSNASMGAGNSVTWQLDFQAAAGHERGAFPTPTSIVINHPIGAPVAAPAWSHMIGEGTDPVTQGIPMPEVDALVLMTVQMTAKTAGISDVLGLYVDFHYEKERLATVSRSPDFYT